MRRLNFASPLHGNFLALLAGLDLACLRDRRASPSDYLDGKLQPSSHVNEKIFTRDLTGRRDLQKGSALFG